MSYWLNNSLSRALVRPVLRQWGSLGRAHGYFYQAMETYGPELGGARPLLSKLPNGLLVDCVLSDHVQRMIYFMGCYEPIEAYLFCRLIQPGWTVFDVGSNIGQYSLLASTRVGPHGQIHAFEPVPRNFQRAQANFTRNAVRNVQLHQLAAWNERGTLSLGLANDMTENCGSYSIGEAVNSAVPTVSVPTIPLDEFVAEHKIPRVHLVKIDIEGSELNALKGFSQTLRRDQPIILMEVNRIACQRSGYDPEALWQVLVHELGYQAWRIGHSGQEWQLLSDPSTIVQSNCLFTVGPIPDCLLSGWSYRHCICWGGSHGAGDRYMPPAS